MMIKSVWLSLLFSTIFLVGCSKEEYSSDATGKIVNSVDGAGLRQVCADGILYLTSMYDIVIQRDINDKPIGCSVKSGRVLEHVRQEFEDEQVEKLRKRIEEAVAKKVEKVIEVKVDETTEQLEQVVSQRVEEVVGDEMERTGKKIENKLEQKVKRAGEMIERKIDLINKMESD